MLKFYFSKGFGILECNFNSLEIFSNEVKLRILAEEINNSDYIMTCINTITSTSHTLKKLLLHESVNSSYNQTEFNDEEEIIKNTFITYVDSLLEYINHPALLQ